MLFNDIYHFISIPVLTTLYHLNRGFLEKGRAVMREERVLPRTQGIQGHEGNSNTRIDESVKKKGDEESMLEPS